MVKINTVGVFKKKSLYRRDVFVRDDDETGTLNDEVVGEVTKHKHWWTGS